MITINNNCTINESFYRSNTSISQEIYWFLQVTYQYTLRNMNIFVMGMTPNSIVEFRSNPKQIFIV